MEIYLTSGENFWIRACLSSTLGYMWGRSNLTHIFKHLLSVPEWEVKGSKVTKYRY